MRNEERERRRKRKRKIKIKIKRKRKRKNTLYQIKKEAGISIDFPASFLC